MPMLSAGQAQALRVNSLQPKGVGLLLSIDSSKL